MSTRATKPKSKPKPKTKTQPEPESKTLLEEYVVTTIDPSHDMPRTVGVYIVKAASLDQAEARGRELFEDTWGPYRAEVAEGLVRAVPLERFLAQAREAKGMQVDFPDVNTDEE